MMDRAADAWAAGFIDGEGCISIHPNLKLRVTVSQVNPRALHRLRGLYGGHITKMGSPATGHRQAWKWEITTKSAVYMLRMILPFLTNKSIEADIALRAELNWGYPYSRSKPIPVEVIASRTRARLDLQIAKRVEYGERPATTAT